MQTQWKSKQRYEHPAKHQAGVYGHVVLSGAGVYALRVGGSTMSCPQAWAAKIQHDEQAEVTMGRPQVGEEMLAAITVPSGTREALEKKAESLGISVPDLRREAYQKILQKQP